MAIDSRIETSVVTKTADPSCWHDWMKLYVWFPAVSVNDGGLNGGKPLGISP